MVHCSQLLLESDWPMPECSESLGLFFGGPKTELNHSLYAAVWDTTNSTQFPNVELSSRVDVWSKGDSFTIHPPQLTTSLTFLLLGFLKQKTGSWKVRLVMFEFLIQLYQAYFGIFNTSSLSFSDTLSKEYDIVSVQVQSMLDCLRNTLFICSSFDATPLHHLFGSRRTHFVTILDSFRCLCINPTAMPPVPTLTAYINNLRTSSSQISSSNPLTYDPITLPSLTRPQLSLKRTLSTTSNVESDSKRSSILISTAISQIVDILVNLQQKLDNENKHVD